MCWCSKRASVGQWRSMALARSRLPKFATAHYTSSRRHPAFAHDAPPIPRLSVTTPLLSILRHGSAIRLAAPGLSERPVQSVCAASATTATAAAKCLPTAWLSAVPSHADAGATRISSVTATTVSTAAAAQHAPTHEPAICANASSDATTTATPVPTAASSCHSPEVTAICSHTANAAPENPTCPGTGPANRQHGHRANRWTRRPTAAV